MADGRLRPKELPAEKLAATVSTAPPTASHSPLPLQGCLHFLVWEVAKASGPIVRWASQGSQSQLVIPFHPCIEDTGGSKHLEQLPSEQAHGFGFTQSKSVGRVGGGQSLELEGATPWAYTSAACTCTHMRRT
eukprot:1159145-Pelagomonas_calceolata.AAC.1